MRGNARESRDVAKKMRTEWNPGPSKGRAFIDKLRTDNVISGWDSKHNRFERTGETWSEQEVDKLGEQRCAPAEEGQGSGSRGRHCRR